MFLLKVRGFNIQGYRWSSYWLLIQWLCTAELAKGENNFLKGQGIRISRNRQQKNMGN